MTTTDRSAVTLDRREQNDRRRAQQRGADDRRTEERRQGSDRRKENVSIDFEDRRSDERRDADRREEDRRTHERRQGLRRTEAGEDVGLSDDEFKAFEAQPVPKTQRLSQILLVVGIVWLLTGLSP